jgi:uncharacterized protein (TIGR02996 family)
MKISAAAAMPRFALGDDRISCPLGPRFAILAAMDYEHPFVAEIRTSPHEDAPRLVFADYLDEAGDPQGELIRVQVALSHLAPGDPERRELELREEALLAEYADAWLAPLKRLGAEGVSARSFQRGLIERVRIQVAAFLQHGEELCRQAPGLHCLELRGIDERTRVATFEFPAQITALDFSTALVKLKELDSLAQAGWTGQIADLTLSFNQLADAALRSLLRAAWPRLVRLNLNVNRLGPESMGLVANHQPPLLLESLSVSLNKTGDLGLQLLGHAPLARTLRELDVSSTGVTAAGVARMAASPLAASLVRLGLRANPLGAGSEDALAALAIAPRLTHLDLRGTHRSVPRTGYGSDAVPPPEALVKRLGEGLLW